MASYGIFIFQQWAAIAASGVAFALVFGGVLLVGNIDGVPGFILPISVVIGIVAEAFQFMQNGQLVGEGVGSILYVFIGATIVAAIGTFLGALAGGSLALGILELSKRKEG